MVLTAAAQGPPGVITIRQIDTTAYPTISAIVEVSDSRGLPVPNLSADGLRVLEDGLEASSVSLTSTIAAEVPVGVVLVLDTSGSMVGEPLNRAKEAAKTFLDQLAPLDQVSVVAFSSEVKVVQGFTADKEATKPGIDALVAEGETKLYDALYSSVDVAEQSGLRHTLVVLLTDGQDTQSTQTIEAGIQLATKHGIPVFPIGLGEADQTVLNRIAQETGGVSLYAPSADALAQAYQSVAQWLKSFYLFTYLSPQRIGPPQRTLEVKALYNNEELVGSITFDIDLPPISAVVKNLEEGERVEGRRFITVEVDQPQRVVEVAFTLDRSLVTTLAEPPFEMELSPDDLEAGQHVLGVRIRDIIQRETSQELSFAIPQAPSPPPPPKPAPFWQGALQWLSDNRFLVLGLASMALAIMGLVHLVDMRRRGIRCPSCQRSYRRRGGCPYCSVHPKAQPRPLGQILIEAGLVTPQQLDAILAKQEETGKLLGEMLTEQKLVSRRELRTALQMQAKQTTFALRLQRLFQERERALRGNVAFVAFILIYAIGVALGSLLLYAHYFSIA